LSERIGERGITNAVKYDWRKSHPIAKAGFGLLAVLGIAAISSIGALYVHSTYSSPGSGVIRNESPRIEQSQPVTNYRQSDVFDTRYQDIKALLD